MPALVCSLNTDLAKPFVVYYIRPIDEGLISPFALQLIDLASRHSINYYKYVPLCLENFNANTWLDVVIIGILER